MTARGPLSIELRTPSSGVLRTPAPPGIARVARSHIATLAWSMVALCIAPDSAAAQPSSPVIVGLAYGPDGSDARLAMAVGPAGQVYEPDGRGSWIRRHGGGITDEVTDVTRGSGGDTTLVAVTRSGTLFGWNGGTWSRIYLGKKPPAILGRGNPAVIAVGATVWVFRGGSDLAPITLPPVSRPIVAAASSSSQRVIVQTSAGLQRFDGTRWKAIDLRTPAAGVLRAPARPGLAIDLRTPSAGVLRTPARPGLATTRPPRRVDALLSDRWAIDERGLVALDTKRTFAWPVGFRAATAIAVADTVVAIGRAGASAELAIFRTGKWIREPAANLDPPQSHPIAGLIADRSGRVVVALSNGQLAIRDRNGWTSATVRTELMPARPGPPPAVSKDKSR